MAKLFASGKFFGHAVGKVMTAAQLTGAGVDLFLVDGGPIRIVTLGFMVTEAIPAGANTLTFRFTPTSGSITDLGASVDLASGGISQLYLLDGAKATGTLKSTDVGILADGQTLNMENIIVSQGSIKATFSGGPPATGAGLFFLEYWPLSHTTRVTVA